MTKTQTKRDDMPGLGLGISLYINRYSNTNSVYTSNLLDQASTDGHTAFSGSVLTAFDAMMVSLDQNEILSLLDVLWVLATNGDSDFAKYNVLNPGSFTCSDIGTPTFTSLKGFNSTGGNNGLSTNWTASTDSVNYQLNNASVFSWQYETPQSLGVNQNAAGVADGSNGNIQLQANRSNNTQILAAVNSNSGAVDTATGGPGLYMGHRIVSNESTHQINTTVLGDVGGVSTQLPTKPMYICGRNNNSVFDQPYTGNVSIVGAGASLISKAADLYSIFNTYMTEITI